MGKKGGKKKGGKGKKSGGGKKGKGGVKEDEMTLKEAILAFQIQVKEKAAEELRHEIKGLQEKNKRHQARNIRLKEEQQIHIRTLLKQAKEQEKELEQREVFNREHVEQTMMKMWDLGRSEEASMFELKETIAKTSDDLEKMENEVERWIEYRDIGSKRHQTQIELLNAELEDMQKSFDDMCAHLKRQLDVAKAEVITYMNECMAEQKHLASEKAMGHLDKHGVQEVHENEWLKREAKTHRGEEILLKKQVEELERSNLEIISELLDCQVQDLKISKNFQQDGGFKSEKDFSNMDRRQLSIYQDGYTSPSATSVKEIEYERPKSQMLMDVEERVFSIQNERAEDTDGEDEDATLEENILEQQEFLHLGPLELKLLCVNGTKMSIKQLEAGLEIVNASSDETNVIRTKWPVTPKHIKNAVVDQC